MGRRWMHGKGGHGNGGNGGNGGNDGKSSTKNDMSSCRGYCAVLATCEAAREREASKELATLLLQEIEKIDAENATNNTTTTTNNDNTNNTSSKSIQSLLEEELEEIRGQRHEGTQQVMSVKTGCKGLVLCKIKNKSLCPIDLVKRIFNRVKSEKQPISRWVSRIIPLSHVFYPNEFELDTNIRLILEEKFPGIILAPQKEFETDKKPKADNDINDTADTNNNTDNTQDINNNADINDEIVGEKRTIEKSHTNNDTDSNDNTKRICVEDPYANKPPTYYALQFKQRNHSVVSKNMTFESLKRNCPPFIKASFKYDMKVHFNLIVEVFMNLGGITYIDGDDELISADFNLRRLQTQLFGPPPEKDNPNHPKKANNLNPPKNEASDTNPPENKTVDDNESNAAIHNVI